MHPYNCEYVYQTEDAAATKIQASYRGYSTRKDMQQQQQPATNQTPENQDSAEQPSTNQQQVCVGVKRTWLNSNVLTR